MKIGTLLCFLLLAIPSPARAQGGVPADPIKVIDSLGRPRGGVTITFCQNPATGIPCSNLANVYSDSALTQLINQGTNPLHTDGNGNLPVVYAAPGTYKYTVTGVGITTAGQPFTATVAGTGAGNVVNNQPNTFTALQAFSAGLNVPSSLTATGGGTLSGGFTGTFSTLTIPPSTTVSTTNPVTFSFTNPAAARTYTVPDFGSNDSFVGVAATQTLSNKTLASPTSTGTDSGTETLTNKTLTSPTLTNGNDTGTQFAAKRFAAGSAAPNPTCSVTGAGTGASCAMLSVSSSDNAGSMLISTGTAPSSSGTATLTFSSSFVNSAFCTFTLVNQASSWNARATVIATSEGNLAAQSVNWDNNAVALTASQANSVSIAFACFGHN